MWKLGYLIIVLVSSINSQSLTLNNSISTLPTYQDGKNECGNGTLLSSLVCIPVGYLKGEVPEKPTLVKTRIEINNILEVNDKKMRITLDFYQELIWIDNRIKTKLSPGGASVLNNDCINNIWMPDLWIKNLFDFKLLGVLKPTTGLIITVDDPCDGAKNCSETLNLKRNTLVTYNMEAQATIHCNFFFLSYPLDTQYCEFVMDGSYPYPNIVDLSFELGLFGVTNKNNNIDDFKVEIDFQNNVNQTGIHSIIKLQRSVLPFVIKYYLPCIAIITVSLISFLISVDSTPARVGLLVTQFLTLINILIAMQAESPSSGNFTAIGIYLLTSLFFVVAAFLEFAFVLQLHRGNELEDTDETTNGSNVRNGKSATLMEETVALTENKGSERKSTINVSSKSRIRYEEKPKVNVRKIDLGAFIVGLLLFLVFNLIYWLTFSLYSFN